MSNLTHNEKLTLSELLQMEMNGLAIAKVARHAPNGGE